MAPMKKKAARKPRRKVARRPVRRGRIGRMPKTTTGNFASSTEQYSGGATAGQVYDFTTSLSQLVRTKALMNAYQYYRITSVEMRFKPNYDTFQAQNTNFIPYLYFQYDKSGALTGALDAADFESIGTKAVRLDDKTVVRKWKPSVLMGDPSLPGTVAQFKVSPWLPTMADGDINDDIKHHGATFYISKMSNGDALGYDVDIVLNVQFRKPLVVPAQGAGVERPLPTIVQGNQTGIDTSLNPSFAH